MVSICFVLWGVIGLAAVSSPFLIKKGKQHWRRSLDREVVETHRRMLDYQYKTLGWHCAAVRQADGGFRVREMSGWSGHVFTCNVPNHPYGVVFYAPEQIITLAPSRHSLMQGTVPSNVIRLRRE